MFAPAGGLSSQQELLTKIEACALPGVGFTLYGLWNKITWGADDDTLARLSQIFTAAHVLPAQNPDEERTVLNLSGGTFDFWLPLTNPGDTSTAPFTFDTVTVNIFDYFGREVFSQSFNVQPGANNQRPTNASLKQIGLTLGETGTVTGLSGAWQEVFWTVPQDDWATVLGRSN